MRRGRINVRNYYLGRATNPDYCRTGGRPEISNSAQVEQHFPLHYLVWTDQTRPDETHRIKAFLQDANNLGWLQSKDHLGRTPLQLAVIIMHTKQVKLLCRFSKHLELDMNNMVDRDMWNVYEDSLSTKDLDLISEMYLRVERALINIRRADLVEDLPLTCIYYNERPDFYYEIHIKYSQDSQNPALQTPPIESDVFRIWKSGNRMRIDSTLSEVDTTSGTVPIFNKRKLSWRIIPAEGDVNNFDCYEVEIERGDKRWGYNKLYYLTHHPGAVIARAMTNKIRKNFFDVDKMEISDHSSHVQPEQVGRYTGYVYTADGFVEHIWTRWDHLQSNEVLQKWNTHCQRHTWITDVKYFGYAPLPFDIGPPTKMTKKKAQGTARLVMADNEVNQLGFHFSLDEEVLPVIRFLKQRFGFFELLNQLLDNSRGTFWDKNQGMIPLKVDMPLFSNHVHGRIEFKNFNMEDNFDRSLYTTSYMPNAGTRPYEYANPAANYGPARIKGIKIENHVFEIPAGFTQRFEE